MPSNIGSQTVSILYNAQALSGTVNNRHLDIRKTGIYSGGYLTKVTNTSVTLTALICEISDGTYQVKIQTGAVVTVVVGVAIPYVVLRWVYTGSASADYMDFVGVASPAANDLVVGKCVFAGSTLTGFVYTERATPNTQDLFLKVEATPDTELRVRIRAGRMQVSSGVVDISEQKSDIFSVPSSNSRVYLVYVNQNTGVVAIDSTGTTSVNPVAPNYDGKIVLAEVTLSSASSDITASMIKDVRSFLTPAVRLDRYLATSNTSTQQEANGVFTKADLGDTKNQSNMTISNNQITLASNRKYALSYAISGQPTSASVADPFIRAKWVVSSGDTSWNLDIISLAQAECGASSRQVTHISNVCYIIPSSETVIELHVFTENTTQKAQIEYITINIMSID